MVLKREDLIRLYAERNSMYQYDAEDMLNDFYKMIEDELIDGNTIHIHGFLELGTRNHSAWTGTHPQTGEVRTYPATVRPYCKFGDTLIKKIRSETNE